MANSFVNAKVDLTSTDNTTLYTTPTANVSLVKSLLVSNDSQASSALGPFTISSSTTKVDTRARARAVSLKIANTAASQNWKLGGFRLDIQPDGRR